MSKTQSLRDVTKAGSAKNFRSEMINFGGDNWLFLHSALERMHSDSLYKINLFVRSSTTIGIATQQEKDQLFSVFKDILQNVFYVNIRPSSSMKIGARDELLQREALKVVIKMVAKNLSSPLRALGIEGLLLDEQLVEALEQIDTSKIEYLELTGAGIVDMPLVKSKFKKWISNMPNLEHLNYGYDNGDTSGATSITEIVRYTASNMQLGLEFNQKLLPCFSELLETRKYHYISELSKFLCKHIYAWGVPKIIIEYMNITDSFLLSKIEVQKTYASAIFPIQEQILSGCALKFKGEKIKAEKAEDNSGLSNNSDVAVGVSAATSAPTTCFNAQQLARQFVDAELVRHAEALARVADFIAQVCNDNFIKLALREHFSPEAILAIEFEEGDKIVDIIGEYLAT
ncbi:hypothetical protein Megvenef_00679 [Candidatus Megaera venefica]|uniref:Uncharacterized protein n=1 Tax=Candidatus Megaera venefica TaxID=2055910 RepID=A0ABU5NC10_9RICK|nr:hypothetical protein [Candidatus Megaera venefica]MEA0970711.1 hypothetical protein [Candidatus Megaera venefica]